MPRPGNPNCRPCGKRLYNTVMCADCLSRAYEQERDWYRQTGHCGYCGQPGVFCLCTDATPCGCRDLHDMGSGLLPDALEAFMPNIVTVEQDGLFGDAL